MEPINIKDFEEKVDSAYIQDVQNKNDINKNELDITSGSNRDIDLAIINGLFEFAFNNIKTK